MSNGEKTTNKRWRINSSKSKSKSESSEEKKMTRRPLPRPHETEEEAIICRFHDAQRMARFRAKRKKALEETKALEAARLAEIALISELRKRNILFRVTNPLNTSSISECFSNNNTDYKHPDDSEQVIMSTVPISAESKYSQLLTVIEEIGRDIRLTYAGCKTSIERLKTGIVQAKFLIRDCLLETEVNSRH